MKLIKAQKRKMRRLNVEKNIVKFVVCAKMCVVMTMIAMTGALMKESEYSKLIMTLVTSITICLEMVFTAFALRFIENAYDDAMEDAEIELERIKERHIRLGGKI